MQLDFADIRRQVIIAMFADDTLMERLVLKGGNALALIHHIGGRTSLDVDLSMEGDFEDLADTESRLRRSLEDRFDAAGYVAFDIELAPRPADPSGRPPTWGGYRIQFKLIERERFERLGLQASRRQSRPIAPALQKRTFTVEISKHEWCLPKVLADLEGFTIYVYTPIMIAIEKLRAICQQMPGYKLVRNKSARARDFYDIHAILTATGLDWSTPEHLEIVRCVFQAKDVPLSLIAKIAGTREYHRPDWPAVKDSVSGALESYDFYFDSVVEATGRLHTLWDE